ncbi:hypothetical protein ACVII1_006773 [Bradyrhizobium elkanii]
MSRGTAARVLGEIEPPAGIDHQRVELVKKPEQRVADRKVHRQRVAAERKRHRPAAFAKLLEHREKRRIAAPRHAIENFGENAARAVERDHALILHEATPAVDPVPIGDRIERKEIRVPMDQPRLARMRGAAAEVQLIEHPHRCAIEQPSRKQLRDREPRRAKPGKRLEVGPQHILVAARGVLGQIEQRPSERRAARQAVDPGHRIGARCAAFQLIDRRVEIAGDAGVLPQPGGLDRQQPQRRVEDHARQAHAAQRRREQRGVFRTRAGDDLAARQREAERIDDGAETAIAMMVLAVNVGRDRAADRHEFRAGHDLEEEAARLENGKDVRDSHAGFDRQSRGCGIEAPHPVQAARRDRGLRSDRGIAVGPPGAARDDAGPRKQVVPRACGRLRRQQFGRRLGIVAPAGQANAARTGGR